MSKSIFLLAFLILTLIVASCQQDVAPSPTTLGTTPTSESETRVILSPAPTASSTLESSATATRGAIEPTRVTATPSPRPSRTTSPVNQPPTEESTATPQISSTVNPPSPPEGALISVRMVGQVGVLLDELPEQLRDEVANALLDKPDAYWDDLARQQVRLTKRRLNFRNFVYSNRGQLPLPPESIWSFELDPAGPERVEIQGHDLVVSSYVFSSTLLSDALSPGLAEPRLGEPGGTWNEPYVLPVDPTYLLQRTGNACINEAGFPPNSFDSENAWVFYDYSCQGDDGGIFACHRTRLHPQSCVEALEDRVGTIEAEVQFERLAWDRDLADQVRLGELTHEDGPDLKVVGEDLEINRIIYRYFQPDSCALAEECVTGSGWRRLLQFNATVHNVGAITLEIGPVVAQNPLNNLFQYNTCHAHYHFADYGDFYFTGEEDKLSSKQAFCVESTNRFSNNEWSPLVHDYTCRNQGIQAGWVDEYVAGLDCQWIDITDVEVEAEGSSYSLGFTSNPDRFLCEGSPLLDEDGNPEWESTDLLGPGGIPVNRPICDFVPDWDVNNDDSREITLFPTGSYVTESCDGDQMGSIRNCGFAPQIDGIEIPPSDGAEDGEERENEEGIQPKGSFACEAGELVRLRCSLDDDEAPQVLRLCDFSAVQGTGVGCTFLDSLANEIIVNEGADISFTCPSFRDEQEPGGLFSLYVAPLLDVDDHQPVSCQLNP